MIDSQTPKKQMSIYLPPQLYELLRTESFEMRIPQTIIIEGLLREHYAEMGLLDSQIKKEV